MNPLFRGPSHVVTIFNFTKNKHWQYVVSCYRHAMSKCYQYAINDLKTCVKIKEVFIRMHNFLCIKL
jgi:hypothetical protein